MNSEKKFMFRSRFSSEFIQLTTFCASYGLRNVEFHEKKAPNFLDAHQNISFSKFSTISIHNTGSFLASFYMLLIRDS
jgi:hypothetical protein